MPLRTLMRNQGRSGATRGHDHRGDSATTCADVVHAVMGMRRVELVVLRWPGLRAYNVVAAFPSLALGSAAVQAIADLPIAVSTVVCVYPVHDGDRLVAVVGAHAADRRQRDRAARALTVHEGRGVQLFEQVEVR